MNNRFFFILFFILLPKLIFSQRCFTIYDSLSNSKIAYANIWKENKIYTNSDSEGKFCIGENESENEFKISCIGYKTKQISPSQNSILLSRNIIPLKELVITNPNFKKTIKLGSCKTGNIALTATYDLKFAEAGKAFTVKNSKQQFFSKVKFQTFSSTSDRIIGVRIYSLDENNQPKELLSTENIVCTVKKGNHITTADLTKLLLPVPQNGFFIALQILLLDQNKQYGEHNKNWFFYEPSIGAANNSPNSYYSSSEEGIWKKHENCDLSIEVELSN